MEKNVSIGVDPHFDLQKTNLEWCLQILSKHSKKETR